MERVSKSLWISVGAMAAIGILVLWAVWPRDQAAPGVLEASGRVEGDQAVIGAKVGGRVVELPVNEGQALKQGDLIAQLSSDQVKARLEQAEHELHTAREEVDQAIARIAVLTRELEAKKTAVHLAEQETQARIARAEAALAEARAHLPHVEATLQRARTDFERYRQLSDKGLIAAQQMDDARAEYQTAKAAEEVARRQIAQAEESLRLARTGSIVVELRERELAESGERLREARAAVEAAKARAQTLEAHEQEAQADVADTRIHAPFDGTVLRKISQEGQVVAPGTPVVTFVDLSRLYAKIYVAQGELGKIKIGDPARVYTDAFPKRYFEATVSEVSEQAEFTPRDVHMKDERVNLVFSVKLAIKNPEGVLKPGMPVDARIRWDPESVWGDALD